MAPGKIYYTALNDIARKRNSHFTPPDKYFSTLYYFSYGNEGFVVVVVVVADYFTEY